MDPGGVCLFDRGYSCVRYVRVVGELLELDGFLGRR